MRASHRLRLARRLLSGSRRDPGFEAHEAAASRSTSAALAGIACAASAFFGVAYLAGGPLENPARYALMVALLGGSWFTLAVVALRAPVRWLHGVYFAVTALGVVSLFSYQLIEPGSSGMSLVSAGMLPMAAAMFSRWPTRMHVDWLGLVLLVLLVLQLPAVSALFPPGASALLLAGFATGALLSLGGQIALRAGRYRSYMLTRRLRDVNRAALEANRQLRTTLDEVRESRLTIRKLAGILPTCASCERVRSDDDTEWMPLSDYLSRHGGVALSHGLCPDCYAKAMAELEGGAS